MSDEGGSTSRKSPSIPSYGAALRGVDTCQVPNRRRFVETADLALMA